MFHMWNFGMQCMRNVFSISFLYYIYLFSISRLFRFVYVNFLNINRKEFQVHRRIRRAKSYVYMRAADHFNSPFFFCVFGSFNYYYQYIFFSVREDVRV